MDTTLEFRFVTRTHSDDYRVFSHGGQKSDYLDEEEFAPLRRVTKIVPEHGPSAALFHRDGKIFLVVSGLERGANDFAGRSIRFSFGRIWQTADENEKIRALTSFGRVCRETAACQAKVVELLHEVPIIRKDRQGIGEQGEGVNFDEKAFADWLEAGQTVIEPILCKDERRFDAGQNIWPGPGLMIKWSMRDPGKIVCERLNAQKPQDRPTDGREKMQEILRELPEWLKQHKKSLLAGMTTVAIVAAGTACYVRSNASQPGTEKKIDTNTALTADAPGTNSSAPTSANTQAANEYLDMGIDGKH